uniref:Uncharacterized protein n=1 Tax=Romanomermis culicivorax TaxID=13658 RepID=A0A915KZQ3_ROMCU
MDVKSARNAYESWKNLQHADGGKDAIWIGADYLVRKESIAENEAWFVKVVKNDKHITIFITDLVRLWCEELSESDFKIKFKTRKIVVDPLLSCISQYQRREKLLIDLIYQKDKEILYYSNRLGKSSESTTKFNVSDFEKSDQNSDEFFDLCKRQKLDVGFCFQDTKFRSMVSEILAIDQFLEDFHPVEENDPEILKRDSDTLPQKVEQSLVEEALKKEGGEMYTLLTVTLSEMSWSKANSFFSDMNNISKPALTTKQQYRTLKRRFKFLENECYQEQLRNLQRKLLKLSRDKNFLLDRLQNYEKVSDSSDDSDAVAVDLTDMSDSSLKKPVRSKDSNALVAKPIDQYHLSSISTSSVSSAPPLISVSSIPCCPSLPSQPLKKKRVRNNNKTSSSTNASTVVVDSRQFSTSVVAPNVLPPPISKGKGKKQAAPRTAASAAKKRTPTNNIHQQPQNANTNHTAFVNAVAGVSFQVMQDGNAHFSVPMPVPANLQTIDQQNVQQQTAK